MYEFGSLAAVLATVTAVSLTGVMAPGPVTAVTVAKGATRKEAGALIALGHGMVEMPMIVLVWLGFTAVMATPSVKVLIGGIGGAVLIWMGIGMLRTDPVAFGQRREVAGGCVLAGLTTTVVNPYWFLWWATVGAALVASASPWGLLGVAAFAVTHWLCDLGWLSFLSWGVFTSRRFWTPRVYRAMLIVCGVVLLGFGAYFAGTGVLSLIRPAG
jgi:threonine/homoserine/homoserine lactone efflux protein